MNSFIIFLTITILPTGIILVMLNHNYCSNCGIKVVFDKDVLSKRNILNIE